MKEQVVLEVQQSVVRQTDGACFTLSCHNARSVSYSLGIVVWDNVFLLGRVYVGFKVLTKLLKPLSSTMEKGWKSVAIILASSSSMLCCLDGVITLGINWLILL